MSIVAAVEKTKREEILHIPQKLAWGPWHDHTRRYLSGCTAWIYYGRTELDAGDDDSGDESSTTASATEEDFKAEGSSTDSDSYERVRPAKRRRLTDRARPHCKYPECEKVARAKGKCIRHGGGKRRFEKDARNLHIMEVFAGRMVENALQLSKM
ncbi:hypothetical protein GQ600_16356 [Phytophthora cactorum]|nr:hypothetical protein GQ600_16356 [Phytophthora cactorum]